MDPLSQLRDIHLGNTISWWPLAYGWWIALCFSVIVIGAVTWFIIRRRQLLRARRAALLELQAIDTSAPDAATRINQLLKRVAMHYYPDAGVSALYGDEWTAFLASTGRDKEALATVIKQAQVGLYQPNWQADCDAFQRAGEEWIKGAITTSIARRAEKDRRYV
ncbi:DUF4381 domain-containing protein [Aestuariibacter salexigens]|uniref:DUF4381 domain-containing protein n=1 Tax=Aestuariibacter salexigens TaxID=226010 RepID=UPI00040E2802|nr:DUF4381 domain-containing protein [Aestuariibacter salexigens]